VTTTVVVASSTSLVVVVSRYLSVLMVVSSYVAERGGPGGFLKLADSLEPRHKLNALMCVTRQISLIISLANILSISSSRVILRTACHKYVSVMFGIGRGDERNIGFSRIFEAMGNRHRIISQILGSILYF